MQAALSTARVVPCCSTRRARMASRIYLEPGAGQQLAHATAHPSRRRWGRGRGPVPAHEFPGRQQHFNLLRSGPHPAGPPGLWRGPPARHAAALQPAATPPPGPAPPQRRGDGARRPAPVLRAESCAWAPWPSARPPWTSRGGSRELAGNPAPRRRLCPRAAATLYTGS